jgi:hypothetical protein
MTGVRIGEAIELRWGDIDFGAKRLQVRRAVYLGWSVPRSPRRQPRLELSEYGASVAASLSDEGLTVPDGELRVVWGMPIGWHPRTP